MTTFLHKQRRKVLLLLLSLVFASAIAVVSADVCEDCKAAAESFFEQNTKKKCRKKCNNSDWAADNDCKASCCKKICKKKRRKNTSRACKKVNYCPTTAAINDDDSTVDIWDIQSFVNTKLKSGEKYIKLPTGRHYVQPSKWGVHLRLSNLADVTIDGRDTELICTRTTRAITVSNCHNTKLVGLKIDYDPLPYTQGVIIDMSEDKLILYIEIMSGYPYPGGNNYNTNSNNNIDEYNMEDGAWDTHKVEIYSPSLNDELATATYYGATFEEEDAKNDSSSSSSSMRKVITVRKKPSDYPAYDLESIGDIAVIGFRNVEKMIHHAVLVEDSVDTVIDGVTIYASNMFAFFEKDSQNSMYSNNVVDRRPIDEDYYATTNIHTTKQRSYRRLRSANADGFHSKHGKAPSYVNCTARYNGDDGIAINGHYHIITKIVETTPDASVPGGGTTKIRSKFVFA